MLKVENLSVSRGGQKILNNICFSLDAKSWLMIAGPNGAGKSTLINAISQCARYSGEVTLNNKKLAHLSPGEIAKNVGVLAQSHYVSYSFTVYEVVCLGRYAYSKGFFKTPSAEDEEKIEAALKATGMASLRDRSVLTLSGGELRRAFLAQLIAQDPQIIILDEPSNDLDLKYQQLVFELIKEWISETGRAAISAVHDLSLAKAYGTHAMLLCEGELMGFGKTNDVLTAESLNKIYSMDVAAWMDLLHSHWVKG